ncbi:MAG: replication-associated recombination protein A [Candidatus Saccharibacteria bacterium]
MNLFESSNQRPLADRVRPKTLAEYIGQHQVVGEGQFLRTLIEGKKATSLILWGPPGTGKTTLARIIAVNSGAAYEEISAVTSGIADVKKVIDKAKDRHKLGQQSVLFVDEIHRFNKAQQDAFLPHVESGTITLIGATTENPSFEVIGPLLSRSRVIVLESLSKEQLQDIIRRGLKELPDKTIAEDALDLLSQIAAGDARMALNGLEAASEISGSEISLEHIKQAMQKTSLKYDKTGEYHYNVISAFIKSMRGSDVDAALFYLGRMLESGEDVKFIARRMVIFASEDIGLADNSMLTLATNTFMAIERIGMPEGRIILGHCVVALTKAPKDRSAYDAIGSAIQAVKDHPGAEVPLHLRNAPTKLMKELEYGKGTKWEAGFEHPKGFLPDELKGQKFYKGD